MKKTFKLQTMEIAEAAVEDAENFGFTASLEEVDGEISVGYCAAEPCCDKEKPICWDDIYSAMRSVSNEYEYQLKWIREDVSRMSTIIYEHVHEGHLPKITDAGVMKKALASLGLAESFEVKVPAVYVQY